MRKPRLNSAVATVAVETVLSLLRVASLSFVIVLIPDLGHPGWRHATHRPGMTVTHTAPCDSTKRETEWQLVI